MGSEEYLLPKYRHLHKSYDALTQCNRCGFCETACPTYVVSGKETLSPRGRNQALRQILEGKNTDPEAAAEIFSTCLTCHACTNVCFSQVPVAKLMGQARQIANEMKAGWKFESAMMRLTLFHRGLLSVMIWIGFFFKRIGVSSLLKSAGLLGLLSPQLEAAEDLIENAPWKFGAHVPSGHPSDGKTAYFSGCGIHYVYPKADQACLDVLAKRPGGVTCGKNNCCGLPLQSAGDIEGAKLLAEKNIRQFAERGVERIIVNDDSCGGFMKTYGELLEGDVEAVGFAGKVQNLSEYLIGASSLESLKKDYAGKKVRVTYHDPCQTGNGHQSFETPRLILKNLIGVEFVEMEESNWCCGGAGTYCLKHPHLADDVLERKLTNIRKCGAQIVVSQASSCLMHVEYGLRKKGWEREIRAMHLGDFLEWLRRS